MRVQTSPIVDISQNSNGHISVMRDATVLLKDELTRQISLVGLWLLLTVFTLILTWLR